MGRKSYFRVKVLTKTRGFWYSLQCRKYGGLKMIFKSEVNEVNAVLVLEVNENDKKFELEYTYDSSEIVYDKIITSDEVKAKIEQLRSVGFKGDVKN